MSDTPASWQPDPTGRHDHRYWDGSQWTDHVADAGVAATDPYDGGEPPSASDESAPAGAGTAGIAGWSGAAAADDTGDEADGGDDATGEAEADVTTGAASGPAATTSGWGAVSEPAVEADQPTAPEEPAPAAPSTTTSGWARPDEAAPTVSGWRTAEPDAGEGATAGAGSTPPAEDTTAVTPPTGWGEETAVTDAAAATTSTWTTPAEPVPHPDATDHLAAPAPSAEEPQPTTRRSRRGVLLLVLALLVIVGVIVALVLVSDDDESDDDEAIVDRISSTLQDDLGLDARPADCIGEHIVDEIGASRLQDVDFDAPQPPADLEDDFNNAFEAAIDACDVDRSDLRPDGDESGAGDGDDASDEADAAELAALLSQSYQSTLGLPEDKASCLADRMAGAVQSGELSEDEAFQEFFDYLDDCQITLEQLNPTTVAG